MMADPDILSRLDDLQTSVDAIVRGLVADERYARDAL